MKAVCEGCGSEIDFKVDEEPRILNVPAMSVAVLSHPHTGYCFVCKTRVALLLAGVSLHLRARPVQEQKPPIVIAPAGALPKVPR